MRLPTGLPRFVAGLLAVALPLVGGASPAGALHRPSVGSLFFDAWGENGTLPTVDLIHAGGAYEGGTIALRAGLRQPLDPRGAFWRDEPVETNWFLDTTGDGVDDWVVRYYNDGSDLVTDVTTADGDAVSCQSAADFYSDLPPGATEATRDVRYLAYIPASCVGSPAAFALAAGAFLDDPLAPSFDLAPDDDGYGATVTRLPGRSGYWMLTADASVYGFGDAKSLCNAPRCGTNGVDIEPTPTMNGYWVLRASGGVTPFGDARLFQSSLVLQANERAVSLSSTPNGLGVWIFTNRGRVITLGDAPFLGDMSDTPLNGEILDSVATPSGRGYYMVGSDGAVFSFGDAKFHGSTGDKRLNAPVRSLVPDGDGTGYWLVASDGGIFAFDAPFRGSMGGVPLNKPVRGMVRYGNAYLMVAEDGGIFNFSDQPFSGSLGSNPPASPIISVAALDAA